MHNASLVQFYPNFFHFYLTVECCANYSKKYWDKYYYDQSRYDEALNYKYVSHVLANILNTTRICYIISV